jgi:small subunit ribosomal protein S8
MVTDKIGDLIIKLKNAGFAGKENVVVYGSKNKEAIIDTLVRAGYVKAVSKKKNSRMVEIELAYKTDKTPRITDVQRVSKNSRRVYSKFSDIRPFKNGFGSIIFSTSNGILTDKEAFKQKVGGEVLFKIW